MQPVLTEQELDFILSRESCPIPAEWEEEAEQAERDVLAMIESDGFLWTCPEYGVKAQHNNTISDNPPWLRQAFHTPPIEWEKGKPEVLPKVVLYTDPTAIVSNRLETIRNEADKTVTFRAPDGRHVSYSCSYRDGTPLLDENDANHLRVLMRRFLSLDYL